MRKADRATSLTETRGGGRTRRSSVVAAKVSAAEAREVRKLAKLYAGGSTSKWARIAMLKFRPKAKDLK